VLLTKSQVATGIMSVPAGRAQKVFGVLPTCAVQLAAPGGAAYELSHKCYPSQATQVFLHGMGREPIAQHAAPRPALRYRARAPTPRALPYPPPPHPAARQAPGAC
jgi:hypothetical protein